MFPTGFVGVEHQLWLWLVAMIRPGAAFLAAPIYDGRAVPLQLRLILSLAIGMAAMNSVVFQLPPDGLVSLSGVLLVAGEVLAGLAMGFALQIAFAAALVAGETIGNAMGLGFASLIDPHSGQSSQVVGQFLSIIATFLLLGMDGHLLLISYVVQSYQALPPGGPMLSNDAIYGLVMFGGSLLASGVTVALPVAFAFILIQLVMALLARSAPSLNIFAVGLPVTLTAGLLLLATTAPILAHAIADGLRQGLDQAQTLAGGR